MHQAVIPPPKHVAVSFSSEVIPPTIEILLKTCAHLANSGVQHLHLLISTPGGSVMHGLTAYNFLRALPLKLTTHNIGNVDSIGNVIFLAGERRYACPHATFMFAGSREISRRR
jgi:ATP-dependent protease ClpP protease subunit